MAGSRQQGLSHPEKINESSCAMMIGRWRIRDIRAGEDGRERQGRVRKEGKE